MWNFRKKKYFISFTIFAVFLIILRIFTIEVSVPIHKLKVLNLGTIMKGWTPTMETNNTVEFKDVEGSRQGSLERNSVAVQYHGIDLMSLVSTTNKYASGEDSDQPANPRSLISCFGALCE